MLTGRTGPSAHRLAVINCPIVIPTASLMDTVEVSSLPSVLTSEVNYDKWSHALLGQSILYMYYA